MKGLIIGIACFVCILVCKSVFDITDGEGAIICLILWWRVEDYQKERDKRG